MPITVPQLHEIQNVLFEVFKTLSLLEAIAVVLLVKVWSVLKVLAIIRGDEHCRLFHKQTAQNGASADATLAAKTNPANA